MWPREDTWDDLAGDQVRRQWVYNYWNAGIPENSSEKHN